MSYALCGGAAAIMGVMVGAAILNNNANSALCVNGHPAKRSTNVTYAGLPPQHGMQRDHYISLGLGGLDQAGNVFYQRCDKTGEFGRCEAGPAKLKDDDEHEAEEKFCSSRWSLDYARTWLASRWPVDQEHGYLMSTPTP